MAAFCNGHMLTTGLTGAIMGPLLPRAGAWGLVRIWPLAMLPGMALHLMNDSDLFLAGLVAGAATLAVLVRLAIRRGRRVGRLGPA